MNEPVGLRFTVPVEHEEEVADIFRKAGIEPMRVELEEGCATFLFGHLSEDETLQLAAVLPIHYSAKKAYVIGKSFPFVP